jgi:type IV pilus assembly protein PilM
MIQVHFNRYPIAIDLGDGACATALQLASRHSKLAVSACLHDAPDGDNSAELSEQDCAEFLRKALHHTAFNGKRVALLPPRGTVLHYTLHIVLQKDEPLEDAIVREAEGALDLPLDEAVIDYVSVQNDPQDAENARIVQLVVIRSADVERLTRDVAQAGGILESIEPPVSALLRAHTLCGSLSATPAVLCHLGRSNSLIAVASHDAVHAIRDVSWSTGRLRRKLTDNLDLHNAHRDVGHLLKQHGVSGAVESGEESPGAAEHTASDATVAQLLEPLADDLVHELHSVLGYVRSSNSGCRFDGVYLYGEGAHVAGLDRYLGYELGLPVRAMNPAERLGFSAAESETEACSALALGMGMRALRWL